MHIHILGIGGTFMAGIAVLAKQQGHHVTGSDQRVYPPMSTQLETLGIELHEGYDAEQLTPRPDLVIVGNTMKRGMPVVEALLNSQLPFISGPQWLFEFLLRDRHVIAVAGTHGKTTTSSMIAWILEYNGKKPGFLIGGIPQNFGFSAQLGEQPFFVIEADEYDTAFFDKRSKFIHYHPRTLVLNNLEFDHADIFPDLAAIKTQFHHLIRTVPNEGLIIAPENDTAIRDVLTQGCWTPIEYLGEYRGKEWEAREAAQDGSRFSVYYHDKLQGAVEWSLLGHHNINNALAAIAAAQHTGITPENAIKALHEFKNVKRRMEIRGIVNNITVYDDFAHHPTAIATTLNGLREHVGKKRIIAVLELGSYTMRTGVHRDTLAPALQNADIVFITKPIGEDWGIKHIVEQLKMPVEIADSNTIVNSIANTAKSGDHILIMSNTGFDNLHDRLLERLSMLF